MTVVECLQRSPEWTATRVGCVTSSRAADVFATVAKGEAAGRKKYRAQLVIERLSGRCAEQRGWVSDAMRDGIEREADARALYEALTGRIVQEVGFCRHDDLRAGASPDGVINAFEGLVEAKCPEIHTHFEYLTTGVVPNVYLRQIHHQMWVTGAQWCDFISFQPDWPGKLQMRMVRVARTSEAMAAHEQGVRLFLDEVERDLAVATRLLEAA